jgi:hypothetical protein
MGASSGLFVAGVILGVMLGGVISAFVTDHNVAFHQVKYRKELVELGVGSYDSRTGGFMVKACGVN